MMDKADAIVEAELAEESRLASAAQKPAGSKKDWKRLFGKGARSRKPYERVIFAAMNIAVLMLGGVIAGSNIMTMYPYAITANNEVICYVDDNVSKSPDKFPEIAIASTKTETRKFTPDPIYVKDEDALAGTTVVKEESVDGRKAVTIDYVTVNGEVVKEEETKEVILDEGRSATIEKGVLGLPEGESWETYEGDPVFSSGEDLVTTALTYVGKVKYVRGGTSLTKGVDCTGFVQEIYKLYGIKLKAGIRHEGISVKYKNAQPGDVICYPHHYAIYMGNGKVVHAAGPKYGVTVSKVGSGGKITDVRRIVR